MRTSDTGRVAVTRCSIVVPIQDTPQERSRYIGALCKWNTHGRTDFSNVIVPIQDDT